MIQLHCCLFAPKAVSSQATNTSFPPTLAYSLCFACLPSGKPQAISTYFIYVIVDFHFCLYIEW